MPSSSIALSSPRQSRTSARTTLPPRHSTPPGASRIGVGVCIKLRRVELESGSERAVGVESEDVSVVEVQYQCIYSPLTYPFHPSV